MANYFLLKIAIHLLFSDRNAIIRIRKEVFNKKIKILSFKFVSI